MKPKAKEGLTVVQSNTTLTSPTITQNPSTTGMDANSHPQSASNKVDAKKPNMGGLAEGHCRKEAWTSRKPNGKWTRLDDPHAINFPLPTQMQSTGAKAATSQLKRTHRIFLNEAHRFKAEVTT